MKMQNNLNRRRFLQRAALSAATLTAVRWLPAPNLYAAGANGKLNCALIGCGGRGMSHLKAMQGQNVVAAADPYEPSFIKVRKALENNNADAARLRTFADYRQMFDKLGKEIDAVFIAAPNHHHALPAMIAMQLGKNVYCEKPVCRTVAEARMLREMAAKTKVATQMGNQGHCEEGYRRLCEYVEAGVIGKITETHSWTNRANGGEGPRPPSKPAPQGMNWDAWIGPSPYRDFHDDLHPHEWHGWYDFGNGSIGNMGCHVLDGLFWALKIEHPTSIEAEQMRGGSDERFPTGSRLRWDVPARGNFPALKVFWYEGLNPTTTAKAGGTLHTVKGDARYIPPLLKELHAKYPDDNLDGMDSGTLYIGEKGIIYTGTYGDKMHVVPREKKLDPVDLPKTLPRYREGIFNNFINACLAGKTETAVPFEYGARLTEFAVLGNLAQKAGPGKKVMWDGPNMKVTNLPELNAFVKQPYRQGWTV